MAKKNLKKRSKKKIVDEEQSFDLEDFADVYPDSDIAVLEKKRKRKWKFLKL